MGFNIFLYYYCASKLPDSKPQQADPSMANLCFLHPQSHTWAQSHQCLGITEPERAGRLVVSSDACLMEVLSRAEHVQTEQSRSHQTASILSVKHMTEAGGPARVVTAQSTCRVNLLLHTLFFCLCLLETEAGVQNLHV